MSKYIWLKEEGKPKRTAIMTSRIDSLNIAYDAFTDLCLSPQDRYILSIYTPSKTYTETYSREKDAIERMKTITREISKS